MTEQTEKAWREFAALLNSDLSKMSCNQWQEYRNNRAIIKAYKLINKGIKCLKRFENTTKED